MGLANPFFQNKTERCPFTGLETSYNFDQDFNYDGFEYQLTALNPNVIIRVRSNDMPSEGYVEGTYPPKSVERVKRFIAEWLKTYYYLNISDFAL